MAITGWIKRFNENDEILKYLKEKLDMMTIDSPEFSDLLATAEYDRKMEEKDNIIEKLTNENAHLKELLAKR